MLRLNNGLVRAIFRRAVERQDLLCIWILTFSMLPPLLAVVAGKENATVSFTPPALSSGYIGDDACAECHADKVTSYHATAHAHTSSVATRGSIRGGFGEGHNKLRTANPALQFTMEAKAETFTQTAVIQTSANTVMSRSEEMAIVVGSGRKGQTYLYWDNNDLFQLPVSYWTEIGAWVNSPGYVDGYANFERPIGPRCLECHASAFRSEAPPINRYVRESLSLGISCEKCHGAGAQHRAAFSGAAPRADKTATFIVNPKKLSRDRQMDNCALCHAGIGNSLTPPLSFKPGEQLEAHLTFPSMGASKPVDVHASQIQLLRQSRCFRESPSMSCSTCHEVHQAQRDTAVLAKSCLGCHQPAHCGEFAKRGESILAKCVDCHMPLQETEQIVSAVDGRSLRPKVRNHRIAVYPASKP